MKTIKSFAIAFLIADFFIILIGIIWGSDNFIINSQIAFFSSLFVVIGSFIGYYRRVNSKVSQEVQAYSDRDTIDQIEDPYDLYDDNEHINYQQEFTPEEIKTIIDEEKKNMKNNSFKNTISSLGSFTSVYRIIGYVLLVVGFFYLNNNNILNIYGFLLGISVVPIGTFVFGFVTNKSTS